MAWITLCDYVWAGAWVTVAFSWMYASNRLITEVIRSFTVATFLSTVASMSVSLCTYCGGVCAVAASASVSYLLRASRVATWLPSDFTRFCNAWAREWAAALTFAVVSTSFSLLVCAACSFLNEASASTYSLHFALN